MTLDQFLAGIDRWGADLAQWPEDERMGAAVLLETSPEARAARLAEVNLEAIIRLSDPANAIGQDAVRRVINSVMAQLPEPTQARHSWGAALWEWLGLAGIGREWLPRLAVSMATAAVLGVVVGNSLGAAQVQQLSPIEALAMANTYIPLDVR